MLSFARASHKEYIAARRPLGQSDKMGYSVQCIVCRVALRREGSVRVPYIHTVPYDESDGLLRREYDAAIKRAGKVFHVVGIQSLHPRVLRASIALYQTLMMGEGALPRWTRELLAVVVSRANGCHY